METTQLEVLPSYNELYPNNIVILNDNYRNIQHIIINIDDIIDDNLSNNLNHNTNQITNNNMNNNTQILNNYSNIYDYLPPLEDESWNANINNYTCLMYVIYIFLGISIVLGVCFIIYRFA